MRPVGGSADDRTFKTPAAFRRLHSSRSVPDFRTRGARASRTSPVPGVSLPSARTPRRLTTVPSPNHTPARLTQPELCRRALDRPHRAGPARRRLDIAADLSATVTAPQPHPGRTRLTVDLAATVTALHPALGRTQLTADRAVAVTAPRPTPGRTRLTADRADAVAAARPAPGRTGGVVRVPAVE
ncbi:hypothetical protein ACIA5C_04220 [Actinoplanes sp. NPDC051343]|uniref:hypothetical protein n=1 Tax=Actinoplanes sp. NPDC051343 TaxID=3363906 RepID=UPI0037B05374